jgi:hypothetical protein
LHARERIGAHDQLSALVAPGLDREMSILFIATQHAGAAVELGRTQVGGELGLHKDPAP